MTKKNMNNTDKQITEIAAKHLIAVQERGDLETRRSDSEDFIEVSVWSLKAALEEAYEAGGVRGLQHRGAGEDPVEGHVLKGHVGAAVHGRGDAGVGAQDGDVVLGVAAGEEDLVEDAPGGEDAEGVDEGLEARHG